MKKYDIYKIINLHYTSMLEWRYFIHQLGFDTI